MWSLDGTLFATGALLLQVALQLATFTGLMPEQTLVAVRSLADLGVQQVVFNVFIFMFTFYATAWLVGSRAERLRAIGQRLERVTDDLQELLHRLGLDVLYHLLDGSPRVRDEYHREGGDHRLGFTHALPSPVPGSE